MSITFKKEYELALKERGSALTGKLFAAQLKKSAEARLHDLESILFGEGGEYGICFIFNLYYTQLLLGSGKKTTCPFFAGSNYKAEYVNTFLLSVTPSGDGTGGLHPPRPDIPSAGQEEVNLQADWLTSFGLEAIPTGNGVRPKIEDIILSIEAVYDEDPEGFIVYNGVDTPDTFSFKIRLIQKLKDLKILLSAYSESCQLLLEALEGANKSILEEFKVKLPISDSEPLTLLKTTIDSYEHSLQAFIDYFNSFSTPLAINSKLLELLAFGQEVLTTVNSRSDAIPLLLGDTNNGLRKQLSFWISELVKKPNGAYSTLQAAQNAVAQASKNIIKANSKLSIFEDNSDRWIEPSLIFEVLNKNILNSEKTKVERVEAVIRWRTIMAANKYRLIYQPFRSLPIPLTNDTWVEGTSVWITNRNNTTGLLESSFMLSPAPTETTIFRVQAYDSDEGDSGTVDRSDTLDTKSDQSDIVSDSIPFQKEPSENEPSIIRFSDADTSYYSIGEGDFILVNDRTIAQIVSVQGTSCRLDSPYEGISSIKKLYGLLYRE